MNFHDLNGISLQISVRILWSLEFLNGIANLADIWVYVEVYGNPLKCWLKGQFSIYIKFENVIGLEILSSKLLLHMTNFYFFPSEYASISNIKHA